MTTAWKMRRMALAVIVLAQMLACGGSDSGTEPSAAAPTPTPTPTPVPRVTEGIGSSFPAARSSQRAMGCLRALDGRRGSSR